MIKKLIGSSLIGLVLTILENVFFGRFGPQIFRPCYLFIEEKMYGPQKGQIVVLDSEIESKALLMVLSIEFVLITFLIFVLVTGISFIRSKPKTK